MQILETVSWRALGVLGLGALALVGSRGTQPAPRVVVPIEVAAGIDTSAIDVHGAANEDSPLPIYFTFAADHARWVALGAYDGKSTAPHVREDDYEHEVIATPSRSSIERWRGREVVVDGGCREKLETFAVIARLSGEPAYADDSSTDAWSTRSIMKHGEPVLAAKLASCTTGTFASTAPVRRFERVDDPELVDRARAVMLASSFASKAVDDWKAMSEPKPWTDDAAFDVIIGRDRIRGTTWISMHVHSGGIGCGAPTTNFWGLFRVGANGALEQVALRALDNVAAISELIDIDGTGAPSLLGEALLPTGPIVIDAQGDQVAGDTPPYFGCPC